MPDYDDKWTEAQRLAQMRWGVMPPPPVTAAPPGCICPPGANLTCQAPDCPRKPLPVGGAR